MSFMLKRSCVLASLAVGALIVPFQSAWAAPSTYKIDDTHTTVGFEISHLVVSTVEGKFDKFGGEFVFDPADLTKTSLNAWAETASVDTGVKDRDDHLRQADYFDAAKHPKMTFVSKSAKKTGDKTFDLMGEMTLRGVTKPVTFVVTYRGEAQVPQKGTVQAFKATTTVNRNDFGMNAGKPMVGDEVTITITTEGVPAAQAPATAATAPNAQPTK